MTPAEQSALTASGLQLLLQLGALLASGQPLTPEQRAAVRAQVEAHYQAVQMHRSELGLPPVPPPEPWPPSGPPAETTASSSTGPKAP